MNAIQISELPDRYQAVRQQSLNLCEPLETEDYQVQPMDDASPPKWHLAHTTWFFETFLLKPNVTGYKVFHESFETLFNSYYNGVGVPYPRPKRGFLSRPTLNEVFDYRAHVDAAMQSLLADPDAESAFRIELGLNHEQQHQELILTDLKYNLGNNPLKPAYRAETLSTCPAVDQYWCHFDGGVVEIGTEAGGEFVFDNETPRNRQYLKSFELASRPVSNGEFIQFIEDGGYERPELWLSDGWAHLGNSGTPGTDRWSMPLYWRKEGDAYLEYTLAGEQVVDPHQPVCHISGYEADAYARWRGCRLPSEVEWEYAAGNSEHTPGNFVDSERFHPGPQLSGDAIGRLSGLFGDVWEWTSSSYGPYPGYKPFAGQLGEYNGKFMANQLVLRGGSCATPASHIRLTYRNFFYPPDRWQFSGVRLARDT